MALRFSFKLVLIGSVLMEFSPIAAFAAGPSSLGSLRPDRIFSARSTKTDEYIRDGVISGGHSSVQRAMITDVRWAAHDPFERVVFEIVGSRGGEKTELNRAPFYHVAVSPAMKRIEVSFFGNIQIPSDLQKVKAALQNSMLIDEVDFFPVLEENRWMMAFHLSQGKSVEVVELGNPVRVILDVRSE